MTKFRPQEKSLLLVLCFALCCGFSALGQSFTMDYAHHGATTLTSPTLIPATNKTIFTYYGFPVTNYSNSSNLVAAAGMTWDNSGQQPIQVSFDFIGNHMELQVGNFWFPTNLTTRIAFWEMTDGFDTSDYRSNSCGNVGYGVGYIPVTFATNGVHHIRLSVHGNFGGVLVTNGNTISKYALTPKPNLLMVLGDSYTQGYIPTPDSKVDGTWPSYYFGGWVWQLAKLVPNTIALPSGIGGTGFVRTNLITYGSGTNYVGRVVPDICMLYTNAVNSGLYNQIFITASGTINDDGLTNGLYGAATNVYSLIQNACPAAHIFFVGNWYANYGRVVAPNSTNDLILSNASSVLGVPYYSPVKAKLLDPISTGNYSIFMGSDQAHPTAYGYGVMAQWVNTNLAYTFGTNWDANAGSGSGVVLRSLTVNNGTGSGIYTNGQVVSITASNTANTYFTNWSGQNIANPSLSSTTVTMPAANLMVTANLVALPNSSTNSTFNVSDFGARGDAVSFQVSTVSNSPVVTVLGTNTFTSADVGKIIEVFRAGPNIYYNSSLVVTSQDIIGLITNVVDGTNLYMSIAAGKDMTSALAIVGANNAAAFQSAVDAAGTNTTIWIPAGAYLLIPTQALDPNYVMQHIGDGGPAVRISKGGIRFLGESPTNTVLMGCGAGMNHLVSTMYPVGSPPYVPTRGFLFWFQGPVTNSQHSLVFENLTFDGGLTNGLQPYHYWTIRQWDGEGWDMTHGAVLDIDPTGAGAQMHQRKIFTNCVFQHWRGEILKSVVGTGGTNTFIDIANCAFWDGNASANNFYFGQHIHGCTFNKLVKVMEYYQDNATLPVVFENNLWTNIVSNPLSIVGANTNGNRLPFTIRNNVMYGSAGWNQVSFSPAQNVTVVSNTFLGPAAGVVFTDAGKQGTCYSSNIVIACNNFSTLAVNLTSWGVNTVWITNNVGYGGGGFIYASASTYNTILANNTASNGWLNFTGLSSGKYPLDKTNNVIGVLYGTGENDWAGITNKIGYAMGRFHKISHAMSGSVFYLDDTKPTLLPIGAQLSITNAAAISAAIYRTATLTGSPTILPTGQSANFYWNNFTDRWQTNAVIIPPPKNLRIFPN